MIGSANSAIITRPAVEDMLTTRIGLGLRTGRDVEEDQMTEPGVVAPRQYVSQGGHRTWYAMLVHEADVVDSHPDD